MGAGGRYNPPYASTFSCEPLNFRESSTPETKLDSLGLQGDVLDARHVRKLVLYLRGDPRLYSLKARAVSPSEVAEIHHA